MHAGPFNLRNGDFDLRDAARAAARRVGLTLGEWLDQAIAEHAARLRVAAEDLDETDQIDAIAACLGGLPLDDLAPRRLPRRLEIDAPVRGRLPNMRLLDAAAARLGLPQDPAAAPLASEPRDSQDVIHVARRIAELEDALGRRRRRQPPDPHPPTESRLRRIAESLLEEDAEIPAHRLRRIEARLDRLLEQIERQAATPAPDSEPLRAEMEALRRHMDDLSRAVATISDRAANSGLEPALLELITRIDASRADGVSEDALSPVMLGLLDIRGALEDAPAATARAMAEEIESLHGRLDALDREGASDMLRHEVAALRTQTETLARHIADLAIRVRAQDGLHEQIAQLAARVEDIAAAPRELADRLVGLVDDLRACIERLDASPSFKMLERRIEDIAVNRGEVAPALAQTLIELRDSIDQLTEHPTMRAMQMQMAQLTQMTGDMPRRLSDKLDELRTAIETIASNAALGADVKAAPLPTYVVDSLAEIRLSLERLAANAGVRLADDQAQRLINIEERVAEISDKLDAPPIIERIAGLQDALLARIDRLRSELPNEQIASLRARVEDVHRAVSAPQSLQQPPAGALGETQAAHLEEVVSQLASKFERASAGAQDPRALQAIENQVLRIAERLDRHGETSEAIGALERSISELFSQIGDTRQSAETSINETIARDLSGLRLVQDESERRTRATLEAVHETLEKVVDRLALLEGDVGVLRVHPRREEPAAQAPTAQASALPHPDDAPTSLSDSADIVAAPSRYDMAVELSEPRAAQKSFIAAARRATQLMGGSAAPPRVEHDDELAEARARAFAAAEATAGQKPAGPDHSRKVMLGVAGLVLSMGAYQLLRDDTPSISAVASQPTTSIVDAAQAQETTPAAAATPAPATAQAAVDLDPTPVGTTPARPEGPIEALRKLAEQGQATAQFELASRLVEGRGMTRDAAQALRWLEKAATQNYAPAQYRLGALYEKGAGIDQSMTTAVRWYKSAAQAGHVRAMHNLGVLLADGVDGRPDYPGAAAMFRRAAEFGLRDSQYNLAVLYVRGLGVDPSPQEAYKFFSLAGAQGDADALTRRDELAGRMTVKQINEARRATEAFALRTPDPAINETPAIEAIVSSAPAIEPAAQARANADARVTSLK